MAVRDIRTRLVLDGEQEFKRSLDAAGRSIRNMDSELKVAQSEFEKTGDKQQLLTSKSEILKAKIEQEKEIIRGLNEQIKKSAEHYDENSRVIDEYRIKLNNAVAAQNKLEKQLEETDRELEEFGRDATRVGDRIGDGIGDGAREARRELDDLMDDLKGDLGVLKLDAAIDIGVTGLGAAKEAISSVMSFGEETREGRRSQAFFEFNAAESGLDEEFLKEQRIKIASITGEMDGVYESLNNLFRIGFDQTQVGIAVDAILGSAILVGNETIKIESMADSLQETLASGKASGAFAEELERKGHSLEDFDKALENSKTKAGDLQIALAYLTDGGTLTTLEKFTAYNDALIAAETSTVKLNDAITRLGGVADQVTTPIRNALAFTIDETASFLEMVANGGLSGNTEAYKKWAEEDAKRKKEWQEYWGIEPVEIPVTVETTNLREQLAAMDAQIAEAYNSGNMVEYHTLDAQRDALLKKITELETEAATKGAEAGTAAIEAADEAMQSGAGTAEENAGIIGENIGVKIGNRIGETAAFAREQAAALADGVIAELRRIEDFEYNFNTMTNGLYTAPTPSGAERSTFKGGGGTATREISVNLNVSGRKLASVMVDDIDAAMA